jgi:hypothetical protein
MSNTIRMHRVLRAAPEKVYRAFLDPDGMVKWLPPNGSPARLTIWTPKSVAPTRCRSRIPLPGAATPSAANISNWSRMNAFATRTRSTIRIFPA